MQTRARRGDLHDKVRKIERDGLCRIVSIVPEGSDEYVITLESRTQPKKETRSE